MGGRVMLKETKRTMSRYPRRKEQEGEGDHVVCHPQKSVPSPLVPL